MGIWNTVFGSGSSENPENHKVPWVALDSRDQLRQITTLSAGKPQMIYKHSYSCGISGMVRKRLENNLHRYDADCYFLDVHRHREISNALAGQYAVRHESPQLLVIKEGRLAASASHGAIVELDLDAYLEKKDPGS
jgi:bacillithiol system protein YtxJ